MAKPKSTASGQRRSPSRTVPSIADIQGDLSNWVCVLNCVEAALDHSDAAETDEAVARAHNVIVQCVRNLDRIQSDLDTWEIRHQHTLKAEQS